jgi:D-sedoheptulose 7-phosphate isomerase
VAEREPAAVLAQHLGAHIAAGIEAERLMPEVEAVAARLVEAFKAGGRLYAFGNGGSAADAQHLAGELIGHYRRDRRPLPAVALTTDPSVVTCIANDYTFEDVFARQVEALARPGDVVVGFTTSGRSANVVAGLAAARAAGATTVLFTGRDGGPAAAHADMVLAAPADATARVQELHVLFLHLVSEVVDAWAAEPTGGRT